MNLIALLAIALTVTLAVGGAFSSINWISLLGILIILVALLGPGFASIVRQIRSKTHTNDGK